jgi:anti-sigma factor RsiW
MTAQIASWETLNAYVDGELTAGVAAEVARALARDSALASQVASLTRLKAATQELAQDFGRAGGEAGAITLPALPNRRWRRPALAASLGLVLAIGLAAALVPYLGESPPSWVTQARTAHEAWATPQDPVPLEVDGVVLVALGQAGAGSYLEAYLPDLKSARLTLTHLESVALAHGRAALHAGYRGTRGCKITLLVVPGLVAPGGEALPRELTRHDDGALHAFAWRAGPLGYIMLAEGMDEARLELIAETVHSATLKNLPLDAETRTALRESRERSQPCLA